MTTASSNSLEEFRAAHPAYDETAALDELRARVYARLDADGHVYLDYTGGGLYADAQLRAHTELLRAHTFGNPHSCNPTSRAATALCEDARAEVLHPWLRRGSYSDQASGITASMVRKATTVWPTPTRKKSPKR